MSGNPEPNQRGMLDTLHLPSHLGAPWVVLDRKIMHATFCDPAQLPWMPTIQDRWT